MSQTIYVSPSPYKCHETTTHEPSVVIDFNIKCGYKDHDYERCAQCPGLNIHGEKNDLDNFIKNELHNYNMVYLGGTSDIGLSQDAVYEFLDKALPTGIMIKIITKGGLDDRIIELLGKYRHQNILEVSLPSYNDELIKYFEPGRPNVEQRLETIKKAAELGLDPLVNIIPLFPGLNDDVSDLENLVKKIADAGCNHIRANFGIIDTNSPYIWKFKSKQMNYCWNMMTETVNLPNREGRTALEKYRIRKYLELEQICKNYNISFEVCDFALDPAMKKHDEIPKCGNTYKNHAGKINRIKQTKKLTKNEQEAVYKLYLHAYPKQMQHNKAKWFGLLPIDYYNNQKKIQLLYGGKGDIIAYNKFSEKNEVIKIIESAATNKKTLEQALSALLDLYPNAIGEVGEKSYTKLNLILERVGLFTSSDVDENIRLLRKFIPERRNLKKVDNQKHIRITQLDQNYQAYLVA